MGTAVDGTNRSLRHNQRRQIGASQDARRMPGLGSACDARQAVAVGDTSSYPDSEHLGTIDWMHPTVGPENKAQLVSSGTRKRRVCEGKANQRVWGRGPGGW